MNGIMIQEDTFARPSDMAYPFVEGVEDTPAGPIPRVKTSLEGRDKLGTIGARIGISRNAYSVLPGLYCAGRPDSESPVLVTANYKLTFDTLRNAIGGVSAWIMVLDTRGINVWCAAGKGTFSTTEVIRQVKLTELDKLVTHRKLVLPQLSATGVSGREVQAGCGFRVLWGPISARDIKRFLDEGMVTEPDMRRVTFTVAERAVLIPVELRATIRPVLWILLGIAVISVAKAGALVLDASLTRAFLSLLLGILSGAIVVPILLPWIPGRAFAIKGAIMGLLAGVAIVPVLQGTPKPLEALSLMLFTMTVSSFLAMNFTGSTPFTSPSGVEKEMRVAIPMQIGGVLIAVGTFIGSIYG